MEIRELTCIRCPMGCQLTVTMDGDNVTVTGNTCPRGAEYGKNEVTNPLRTVTSSVRVTGGELPLVSVKTAGEIPKGKIEAAKAMGSLGKTLKDLASFKRQRGLWALFQRPSLI